MLTDKKLPIVPANVPGWYMLDVWLVEVAGSIEGFTVRAADPVTPATFFLPTAKVYRDRRYPDYVQIDSRYLPVRQFTMSVALYRRMYEVLTRNSKAAKAVGRDGK